jgi:predicted dehydrogenase
MELRIGVLGAARITATALLRPAARLEGVAATAVAARDPERAQRWARRHGVPRVLESYEALLGDPDVDAVYIPLPAALHGGWTRRALAAGKHVLVEKPFAANGDDAQAVADAAAATGLTVMEAHHTSFHPMTSQIREIAASGELGEIRSARGWFHVPIPPGKDIRWNAALGGGALMDVGCYPLRMVMDTLGEPTIAAATALQRNSVDRRMTAVYDLGGANATVDCGLWSSAGIGGGFTIVGSRARLHVRSPFHPHLFGAARIDGHDGRMREYSDRRSSYSYQLEAFRDAVAAGRSVDLSRSVATMRVIDQTYQAAGMRPRSPSPI